MAGRPRLDVLLRPLDERLDVLDVERQRAVLDALVLDLEQDLARDLPAAVPELAQVTQVLRREVGRRRRRWWWWWWCRRHHRRARPRREHRRAQPG
ncbi:MAG: hypothetical protein KIT31_18195 [Deltaproteobacteria bacterium]|nr:hypothetical protein [Deltaproteobacteria bacterium]